MERMVCRGRRFVAVVRLGLKCGNNCFLKVRAITGQSGSGPDRDSLSADRACQILTVFKPCTHQPDILCGYAKALAPHDLLVKIL